MSEPQTPPPSPPPAAPAKKGLSPVAWILIGCLGLLLLFALGMGACTFFVAKKAKSFTEELADNPGRTLAELAVKANPELEMVGTDDYDQTITVRNTRTGEEMTLDWSDFENEGFSIRTGEGEMTFNNPENGGPAMTVRDEDGNETTVLGGGAPADVPDFIPMPSGASDAVSAFHTSSDDGTSGSFAFTAPGSVDDMLDFYESELEGDGFEVSKSTFNQGGQRAGSVSGEATEGGRRNVSVAVTDDDGETRVQVSYSSKN